MQAKNLVTPRAVFIDLVLTAIFFAFITRVLIPHVPAQTEQNQLIFAMYGGSCLAGLFWMTVQCIRVTLVDQWRRRHKND